MCKPCVQQKQAASGFGAQQAADPFGAQQPQGFGPPPSGSGKQCSKCGQFHPRAGYSKSQWSKPNGARKCVLCIQPTGATGSGGFGVPHQGQAADPFGAQQPQAFGAPAPSPFGAAPQGGFGVPQQGGHAADPFGAQQPLGFGAPAPSPFGGSPFGAPQGGGGFAALQPPAVKPQAAPIPKAKANFGSWDDPPAPQAAPASAPTAAPSAPAAGAAFGLLTPAAAARPAAAVAAAPAAATNGFGLAAVTPAASSNVAATKAAATPGFSFSPGVQTPVFGVPPASAASATQFGFKTGAFSGAPAANKPTPAAATKAPAVAAKVTAPAPAAAAVVAPTESFGFQGGGALFGAAAAPAPAAATTGFGFPVSTSGGAHVAASVAAAEATSALMSATKSHAGDSDEDRENAMLALLDGHTPCDGVGTRRGVKVYRLLSRTSIRHIAKLFSKVSHKKREFGADALAGQANVHRFLCRLFDENGDGSITMEEWCSFFGRLVDGESVDRREELVGEALQHIETVVLTNGRDVEDPWLDEDDL